MRWGPMPARARGRIRGIVTVGSRTECRAEIVTRCGKSGKVKSRGWLPTLVILGLACGAASRGRLGVEGRTAGSDDCVGILPSDLPDSRTVVIEHPPGYVCGYVTVDQLGAKEKSATFWKTERGSPLKGCGASGSSKWRVVGDDRPKTGLRAHLSRASTAGGQQSRRSREGTALSSAEPAPESTSRAAQVLPQPGWDRSRRRRAPSARRTSHSAARRPAGCA